MKDGLQAGVEDEWLVVALVSQLEESAVGIHSVPKVRPQRQVLC